MPLAVLVVHGVGEARAAWAQPFIASLAGRIRFQAASLAPHAALPRDMARIAGVHWGAVLTGRRRALRRILSRGTAPGRPVSWWRNRWQPLEQTLIADYLGDLLGYLNPRIASAVDRCLTQALARLAGPGTARQRIPLTIIAHSLGTVVSSNYVWDHAKARRARPARGCHRRFRFDNFFTLGSPMALFSLKYGGPEAFKAPVRVEHASGRWINCFDTDDPLGLPLRPLNAAYRRAVAADVPVETGGYLLAHRGYFTEPRTLDLISRKLALDWLAGNAALSPRQASAHYAAYDRGLQLHG